MLTKEKVIGDYIGNFDFKNAEFNFDLSIFKYNLKTGLFLAECKDHFGESAIIGAISSDFQMKFDKYYLRDTEEINNSSLTFYSLIKSLYAEPIFRKFNYNGGLDFSASSDILKFRGQYFFPGISKPEGFWSMEKKK